MIKEMQLPEISKKNSNDNGTLTFALIQLACIHR